ncbi:IclR family transcriptional regulator [Bordetella genomosp. 2]|uniref:IclR family transcriptional regulator n=1 Tax=Bordetella genomosp. 2 TaxID=1983456 RepID=A0A261VPZ7_9BORD|nr:IclR family transcriptional regulator [Bordetella genomosp. 2]OZI75841.1 IclR family transcriptional regulator [Bordetella genomosp. 2]
MTTDDEGPPFAAMTDETPAGAQTVRRAVAILRLVACGQERGVRLIDLVRMSGLNRPTVHRLLKTLLQEGAIEQDPATRRYLIGPEISLLGLARTRRFPLLTLADPYLAELADQVGDTVFLSIRHGHDSICIGRRTGHHPIQVLSIEVGVRRPLGVGVSGVALLACLPGEESAAIVAANAARLAVLGESPADILQRVDKARASGIAHAPAGLMPGTSAVAIPIPDPDDGAGSALGAVTVTAMAERLAQENFARVVERMRVTAQAIARRHAEVRARRPS